jgi:1,4-dihydroxy-2-naphthoyl-CoA hydrolase
VPVTPDPELSEWEATLPFNRLLGITVVSASRQEVVAELPWRAEICTSGAVVHGGAIMSLADSVGAMLAFLNLPTPEAPATTIATTTISSATQFMRGLRSGTARATARLLHRGRTTIVVETDVTDGDGKLVARVTQTQAVLRG